MNNWVDALELNTFDSASITSSYQSIIGTGLGQPCFLIRITNASNAAITISYDGTTDNEYIPADSVVELPFQSNAQPNNFVALMRAGTIIYAKGSAGTGTIYVSGYYL